MKGDVFRGCSSQQNFLSEWIRRPIIRIMFARLNYTKARSDLVRAPNLFPSRVARTRSVRERGSFPLPSLWV